MAQNDEDTRQKTQAHEAKPSSPEASARKERSVKRLQAGVVLERHYVLNWLVGYLDQPWDEVSTDT